MRPPGPTDLTLSILGIAAARPWPGAPAAAALVSRGRSKVLLDCGEGTILQLAGNLLADRGLDVVAITHLHGDHVYGLSGLLTSMTLAGRTRALHLVGPADLPDFVADTLRHSRAHLGFACTYTDADGARHLDDDTLGLPDLKIAAVPLRHRIPAFGYVIASRSRGRRLRPGVVERLEIPYAHIPLLRAGSDWTDTNGVVHANDTLTLPPHPTRVLAYLTDTAPLETWPPDWPAPDCLVHDATFAADDAQLAAATGHSTVAEAAAFAKTCRAGQLLLTHRSVRYGDPEALLPAARAIFPRTRWARDGETIVVGAVA